VFVEDVYFLVWKTISMEASMVLQNVRHQESLLENSNESSDPFYTFSIVTL